MGSCQTRTGEIIGLYCHTAQILNNKQKEGKNIIRDVLKSKLQLSCESVLCDKKACELS